MPLREITECPICGEMKSKHYLALDHRVISKCLECNHIYASEFSAERINSTYASDYHGSEDNMNQWNTSNRNIWVGLCDCISYYLKNENCTLLDIGAGTGGFAIILNELYPSVKLHLLETSPKAHPFLKKKLTANLYRNLSELASMESSFDIITILQTLEHVEEPKSLCKSIYSLLKPHGVLLLTVPNNKSYQVYINAIKKSICFSNQTHIQFFDNSSVKNLLTACGFSSIRRVTQFGNGRKKHPIHDILQWLLRLSGFSTELRFIAFK